MWMSVLMILTTATPMPTAQTMLEVFRACAAVAILETELKTAQVRRTPHPHPLAMSYVK